MQGKICLITGGTSGIGKAAATALAQQEATIVLAARTQARGEQAVREIAEASGTAPHRCSRVRPCLTGINLRLCRRVSQALRPIRCVAPQWSRGLCAANAHRGWDREQLRRFLPKSFSYVESSSRTAHGVCTRKSREGAKTPIYLRQVLHRLQSDFSAEAMDTNIAARLWESEALVRKSIKS